MKTKNNIESLIIGGAMILIALIIAVTGFSGCDAVTPNNSKNYDSLYIDFVKKIEIEKFRFNQWKDSSVKAENIKIDYTIADMYRKWQADTAKGNEDLRNKQKVFRLEQDSLAKWWNHRRKVLNIYGSDSINNTEYNNLIIKPDEPKNMGYGFDSIGNPKLFYDE